ncbi:MAG: hypothetical protein LBP59_10380 [Planctomycetaceae bacterium]|jgi:hypothetical protein|nr:hypothetical protein [Planctomycetaceae bacterium]
MAVDGNISELNFSISVDVSVLESSLKSAEAAIQVAVDRANELLVTFKAIDSVISQTTKAVEAWGVIVGESTKAIEKHQQILSDTEKTVRRTSETTKKTVKDFDALRDSVGDLNDGSDDLDDSIEGVTSALDNVADSTKKVIQPVTTLAQKWAASVAQLTALRGQYDSGIISLARYEEQLSNVHQSLGLSVSASEEYRVKLLAINEAVANMSADEYTSMLEAARKSYAGSYSAAADYAVKVQEINEQYTAGAISQSEYNSRLIEARRGLGLVTTEAETYRNMVAQLEEALRQGNISQREFNDAVEAASGSIDETTVKISALVSVPLLGFLIGNVYAAADFEKALKSVHATFNNLSGSLAAGSDVTGFSALTAAASTLAVQFGADMDDVVDGVKKLGESGMSAAQSLSVLNSVMQVSVVGAISAESAAEILSNAYTSLGLTFEDTSERLSENFAYMANQYAVAAKLAAGSVQSFVQAVSAGAGDATRILVGAAGNLQSAVNDTMAALAVYSQTGFAKGQKAGELFNGAIKELTKSINEHRESWLNIIGFNPIDDMTGSYKDLASIVVALSNRFGHLRGEALKLALAQVGLSVATSRALAPLLQNVEMLQEYRLQLMSGKDAIGAFSDEIGGGLYNELNKITSALQACAVALGNDLLPYVTAAAKIVRGVVTVFTDLPKPVRYAATGFALLVGGLAAAVGGLTAMRMSTKWLIGELRLLGLTTRAVLLPLRLLSLLTVAPLTKGISLLVSGFKALRVAAATSWAATLWPIALIVAGLGLVFVGLARVAKMAQFLGKNGNLKDFAAGFDKIVAVTKAIASNFSGSMKIIYSYLDEVSHGKIGEFIEYIQDTFISLGESFTSFLKVYYSALFKFIDAVVYGFDWLAYQVSGGLAPEFGKVSKTLTALIGGANELGNRLIAGADAAKLQNQALEQSKSLLDGVKKAVDDEVTLQAEAAAKVYEKTEAYLIQRRTLGMASEQASIWELEYKLIGDTEMRLKGYNQRLQDLQKAKDKFAGRDMSKATEAERKTLANLNEAIKITENTISALTERTQENRLAIDKLRVSWVMLQAATAAQEMKEAVLETQKQAYALTVSDRAALDLQMRMQGVNEATRLARLQALDLAKSMEGEKSGREEVKGLRDQIVAIEMGAEMAKRFKLEMQGASAATVEQVHKLQALNLHFNALDEYAKEANDLIDQLNDDRKVQKYGQQLKKYEDMLAAGMIDAQTYARATADAYGKIQEELHVKVTLEGLDDFDATSMKFMKRISEMSARGNIKIAVPKTADEIKRVDSATAAALRSRTAAVNSANAAKSTSILLSPEDRLKQEESIRMQTIPGYAAQKKYQESVANYTTVRDEGATYAANVQNLKAEYDAKMQVAGTPESELTELKVKIAEQEKLLADQKRREAAAKTTMDSSLNTWANTGNATALSMQAAPLREDEYIKRFDDAAMKPLIKTLDAYADNITAVVKSQEELEAATRELSYIMLNSPQYNQFKIAESEQKKAENIVKETQNKLDEAQKRVDEAKAQVDKSRGAFTAKDEKELASMKAAHEKRQAENADVFAQAEQHKQKMRQAAIKNRGMFDTRTDEQIVADEDKLRMTQFKKDNGREAASLDEAYAWNAFFQDRIGGAGNKARFNNMFDRKLFANGTNAVNVFEKQAGLDKAIQAKEALKSGAAVTPEAIAAKKTLDEAEAKAAEAKKIRDAAIAKAEEAKKAAETAKSAVPIDILNRATSAESTIASATAARSNAVAAVPDVFTGYSPATIQPPSIKIPTGATTSNAAIPANIPVPANIPANVAVPANTIPNVTLPVTPNIPAVNVPATRDFLTTNTPAVNVPATRDFLTPNIPAVNVPATRDFLTTNIPVTNIPSTNISAPRDFLDTNVSAPNVYSYPLLPDFNPVNIAPMLPVTPVPQPMYPAPQSNVATLNLATNRDESNNKIDTQLLEQLKIIAKNTANNFTVDTVTI